MVKKAYAYFVAAGLATIFNFLCIIDIMGFVAVQIGGCAMAVAILINLVPSREETDSLKDSPIYYRNWKKNPLIAVLHCVLSLAFIITLAIAVFGMG